MSLRGALEAAVAAALDGGEILRRDFHRPGGPRGHHDKAEADVEAEHAIRARLAAAFPAWAYLGEETGRGAGEAEAPTWLVDPNDGTRDYLKGRRGSAVSIGLARGGRPVLGVVYAFGYPDDRGDLFAWAEGEGPLTRNGQAVTTRLPKALGPTDIVLVSPTGEVVARYRPKTEPEADEMHPGRKKASLAFELRRAGIRTEMYFGTERAGKQIKFADKLEIPVVLLYGPDEKAKHVVTIKDMSVGRARAQGDRAVDSVCRHRPRVS
jgi:hypothetical protein